MRRLLLDTHAFLWWLGDDARLGEHCRTLLADPRNEVYVSAVTAWEIAIKKGLGKLRAPDDIDAVVEDEGFSKLPISVYHGDQAGSLPNLHRDPFDRMLIVQAQAEGLTLVTVDQHILQYPVKTLAADT
ncbi:type II toxin-antitoxin system VapC family toxin [Alloalcanivorax xenomutans]|jgi:PIN domain nuclease of toxin-antitoxin system|uniref:type II toxin-antitoxin system VapC family toxin n=1 Tax=Alloalcanivorax xenomutans TaxID=1094342 RepID=UPI0035A90792